MPETVSSREENMRFRRGFLLWIVVLCAASTALAVNPGTDVVVAAGGAAAGVPPAYWLTDLVIYNPGPGGANITVSYLPRGGDNSNPATVDFAIAAGETLIRSNVVGADFGEESFGALRVMSDVAVVVHSVTKNNPGGADASDANAFGQGFPGIPVARAIQAGQSTVIPGLVQNDVQRSNYGALDVSGTGSTFTVRAFSPSGTELASKSYSLEPWEPFQLTANRLVQGGFDAATIEFEVTSGAIVAYASKVNAESGDASTLEMYWHCGGGRTSSDGTYHFVTTTPTDSISGGGTMTVADGTVTELCGNVIAFDKSPACALWLPYCIQDPTALSAFAGGQDLEVNYSSGGSDLGNITWTLTLSLTDNLTVAGSLTGTGSGWSGAQDGCNGTFPTMTVAGGVR
jgi:hypothetical protein